MSPIHPKLNSLGSTAASYAPFGCYESGSFGRCEQGPLQLGPRRVGLEASPEQGLWKRYFLLSQMYAASVAHVHVFFM